MSYSLDGTEGLMLRYNASGELIEAPTLDSNVVSVVEQAAESFGYKACSDPVLPAGFFVILGIMIWFIACCFVFDFAFKK